MGLQPMVNRALSPLVPVSLKMACVTTLLVFARSAMFHPQLAMVFNASAAAGTVYPPSSDVRREACINTNASNAFLASNLFLTFCAVRCCFWLCLHHEL
jgi:hypothetical protein